MKKIVDKSMLGQTWMVTDYLDDTNNHDVVDTLIEHILANRGVSDVTSRERFLNPSVKEYMPDPSVLTDMDLAVRIIADFIVRDEKIAIYGDYDVDGITATAIFVKFLRDIGADVIWHLPTREGEGYGLNIAAVNDLYTKGARLLITVDCGISGCKEVEAAKKLGFGVVITDHHSPDSIIPKADAVVNPKRNEDVSGLKYLAGVGVAFLTLVALRRELKTRVLNEQMCKRVNDLNLMNYMDCVALGTICDTMPLIELNRAFVTTGLKILGLRQNLGLKTLMDVSEIKKPTVYAAGFALGPRLNAAGRLNSAEPALDLLLTDNPLIANDLAQQLHKMNQERINIQNAIMIDATDQAKRCCEAGNHSLFVCGDNWHGGVMGIIAGRLKDKYNLPSCVATRCDGIINGSGRSIPGIDLGKIIHDALASGVISEGGGHAAAAGFSLPVENETIFREFLENAVRDAFGGQMPLPQVVADADIDAGGATINLVKRLNALEPFGQGNPEPTLILHGGILKYASVMGGGAHLRGTVITSSGGQLSFVGFNLVGTPVGDFLLDDANINTKIMMLGQLKENEYNGRINAQFYLEDVAV